MSRLPQQVIDALQTDYASSPELGSMGGGASDVEIDAAELTIGTKFSGAYREFLKAFGSGLVGPFPVFGIRPTAMHPSEGTVCDVTRRFRDQSWPSSDAGPVIAMDQAGNPLIEESSGRIITFDHDVGALLEVSSDFSTLLTDLMGR